MPEYTESVQVSKTPKSVDITALFGACGVRNKQTGFYNKGVKITDRDLRADEILTRVSVSKMLADGIVTVRPSLCQKVRKTVSYRRAAGA